MKQKQMIQNKKMTDFACDVNEIHLVGTVCGEAKEEYICSGKIIYKVPVKIKRFSGEADVLQVEVVEDDIPLFAQNARVEIFGNIKSFDKKDSMGKTHLVITVVVKQCKPADASLDDQNTCVLAGHVCSYPKNRLTPRGVEITDILLACTCAVENGGRANYIPLITWFHVASVLKDVRVGTGLEIHGRLQSRTYTKRTETGTETRVAYEVSVSDACIYDA